MGISKVENNAFLAVDDSCLADSEQSASVSNAPKVQKCFSLFRHVSLYNNTGSLSDIYVCNKADVLLVRLLILNETCPT